MLHEHENKMESFGFVLQLLEIIQSACLYLLKHTKLKLNFWKKKIPKLMVDLKKHFKILLTFLFLFF